MSSDRGGRPLYPGDGGAHPDRGDSRPAPAASQRPVPAPRRTSHPRGSRLTRHQRGFKQFARPVFPSPVAARMERAALGLSLGLRTPPTKSRRRTPRWGQAIEHGPGTTAQLTSVDLQSGSSLNTCDLASHVARPSEYSERAESGDPAAVPRNRETDLPRPCVRRCWRSSGRGA